MSKGIYNETYFERYPEEAVKDGVLYCVILVNKKTFERECIKIGITKGRTWKDVLKRSSGFKGYDIRIQKLVQGSLEEVFHLEQYLHEKWSNYKYTVQNKFAGHTELFELNEDIVRSIPDSC